MELTKSIPNFPSSLALLKELCFLKRARTISCNPRNVSYALLQLMVSFSRLLVINKNAQMASFVNLVKWIWYVMITSQRVVLVITQHMQQLHVFISGYAREVFNKVLSEFSNKKNIVLTSAKFMVPFYERVGFKTPSLFGIYTAEGHPKLPPNHIPPNGVSIQPITEANFSHVIKFDQSVNRVNRSCELDVYMKSKHTLAAKCAVIGGAIVGTILVRPGFHKNKGVRMTTFQAVNQEIAVTLLYDVLENNVAKGTNIMIGFAGANLERSKFVADQFSLGGFVEPVVGMFNKYDFPVKWDLIYATMLRGGK